MSDEYAINGDYSFKFESSLNQYQGVSFITITLDNPTSRVKLSVNFIKILNGNVEVRIVENNNYTTVAATPKDTPQKITVEKSISTNNLQIVFIFRSANIVAYADEITLNCL